jgi:hypothetical protein
MMDIREMRMGVRQLFMFMLMDMAYDLWSAGMAMGMVALATSPFQNVLSAGVIPSMGAVSRSRIARTE